MKNVPLTREVYGYLLGQAEPPTAVQRWLAARTRSLGPSAVMRVPHEQAVLLTLLARLVDARRVVEVGTFTGYSTLALATGLAPGGTVITCDLSEEWTSIARVAWREAGVEDRIDLRLGPALETVAALPAKSDIDLVFLDADKPNYRRYWELLVPRLRPGGLLIADNVLQQGRVHRADATGNVLAVREFNARVRADVRVESVMLPVADGLTVARRRSDAG
ncbi:O-methyltransferase [Streptomyces sp. OF3]|uniref:O-methyltransferase n=2 Tax=Streptomyces alkaliterrae TaxID=2213162 RepID=A0A5P0YYB2_9ACTN|nr:O-methyltransferase [Streptomyces alkaliterrae]MBB1258124.1 O-methyltransferase [Streptomyces alkaliterrae]MQS04527.1 O-methyltransferase [Streptomyces alkaliterrae]